MNANRNLIIDFRVNNRHDHFIGKDKHVQPHILKKDRATKKKRKKAQKTLKFLKMKRIIKETKSPTS